MVRHATRKTAAREYQAAHPDMTLTEAKRHLAHAKNLGVVAGEVPLAELGGAVLPPDATPAQRARTEAIWRPAAADQPCRCTGDCAHGKPCLTDDPDMPAEQRCGGRLVHVERYPGSLLAVSVWQDEYACDTCGEVGMRVVELPAVPWGQRLDNGGAVFAGVRHPNFRDADDEGGFVDEGCEECGAEPGYRCTCDDLWCEECGATDDYQCNC